MIQPRFKTSMTGVPIMKDAAIEADAERLLRDYNPALLETPQALDVEDFAENYLGLRIHYNHLSHNGSIWGRMVFYNSRIPVYVPKASRAEYLPVEGSALVIDNSLLIYGRDNEFRSTMMHECGHKIYHTQYYRPEAPPSIWLSSAVREQMPATACRQADILGSGKGKRHVLTTDHDWLEHHAKYFGSSALIPASMVRRVYDETEVERNMGYYKRKEAETEFALELMRIFHVSGRSADIRIKQLKLDFASFQATHPEATEPKKIEFYVPDLTAWL